MAGHSKWSTIKHTKEKNDSANAKVFTKIGRELAVAVKMGGADPANNPRLKLIMQKARSVNMPNDNIQRVIKKASGELGTVNYENITYEGYGPSGSAVMVYCLTDNKNRTASDVRHAFDKFGGSLGSTNCVSYLFTRKGIVIVQNSSQFSDDDVMMYCLEGGAEDVDIEEDFYQIYTTPENLENVKEFLINNDIPVETSYIDMIPQNYITIPEDKLPLFDKLIKFLEDNDDVQEVYHNVDNYDTNKTD